MEIKMRCAMKSTTTTKTDETYIGMLPKFLTTCPSVKP
jgi:hypothetical protein